MPRRLPTPAIAAAAPLLALLPGAALAHHPMGGEVPGTALEGLLSGLGHPVIGLDHLGFLLAAGVLAAAIPGRRAALLPLGFVAASAIGLLLAATGGGLAIGPVEALVGLSTLLAGMVLLASGGRLPGPMIPGPAVLGPAILGPAILGSGFALAGLLHGQAFAAAAIGAEPMPLGAYLLGLGLMQAALAGGAFALARRLAKQPAPLRALRHVTGFGAAAIGASGLALLAM